MMKRHRDYDDEVEKAREKDYYDEAEAHEPPPEGYCTECGSYIRAVQLDAGIGPYEYWGARGFDSRPYWGCPKCEAEVEEDLPMRPCYACLHFDEDDECTLGRPDADKMIEGRECEDWSNEIPAF